MSTEKRAPDGVNTLTIDDEGGVTSTLMHVPIKTNTEKDREAGNKWADVVWDEIDLPEEEKSLPETIAFAKACGAMGYSAALQHARQGERERLKDFYRFAIHPAFHFGVALDELVDEFLEQEAKDERNRKSTKRRDTGFLD